MNEEQSKMLKEAVIFVAILLVCLAAINLLYWQRVMPSKGSTAMMNSFVNVAGTHVQNLYLGDSMTNAAIPHNHNDTVNLGLGGDNYWMMLNKLQYLLRQNTTITNLYLQYNVHNIYLNLENPALFSSDDIIIHAKYMTTKELSTMYNKSPIVIYAYRLMPFIGKGENLLKKHNYTRVIRVVSRNDTMTAQEAPEQTAKYAKVHFASHTPIKEQVQHMFEIINVSQKNNITITLVRYPVYHTYRRYYATTLPDYDLYDVLILNQARKLGAHYQNHEGLYEDNQTLFHDVIHLNDKGRAKLSQIMA